VEEDKPFAYALALVHELAPMASLALVCCLNCASVSFCEYCGGMGNLLMMGHAGFLSHEDTVSNLTSFTQEVLPRLKEYKQPVAEVTAA
jgi:hypothetical protein